jgi:hypothetical protein
MYSNTVIYIITLDLSTGFVFGAAPFWFVVCDRPLYIIIEVLFDTFKEK